MKLRKTLSIGAAYQAGQLIKFAYLSSCTFLFGYDELGNIATVMAICLILGGFIDGGGRYYFWPLKDDNCKKNLQSKIIIQFILAGAILVFTLLVSAFLVKIDFLISNLCLILLGAAFNPATYDWYFIKSKKIQSLFLSQVAFAIAPIVVLTVAFWGGFEALAIYSYPTGVACVGILHAVVLRVDFSQVHPLPNLSILIKNFPIVPAQHIYAQGYIPILSLYLDIEIIGKIRLLMAIVALAASFSMYTVAASFDNDYEIRDIVKANVIKYFSLVSFVGMLALHVFLKGSPSISIGSIEVFGVFGFFALAVLLFLVSYEQERAALSKQSFRSIALLLIYPTSILVTAFVTTLVAVPLTMYSAVNVMLLSALLATFSAGYRPVSGLLKFLFRGFSLWPR